MVVDIFWLWVGGGIVQSNLHATLLKKRLRYRFFPVSFVKNSKAHVFKYSSRGLLLKEHWISLKMAAIAIPINVSDASHQNKFVFLRSAYGKFVEVPIETFLKVFLVLEFSLPSEL